MTTSSCPCCGGATTSFLPNELLAPYNNVRKRNETHVINSYDLSTIQNVDNDIKVHPMSKNGAKGYPDREEDFAEGNSCGSGSTAVNFNHLSFDLSPRFMNAGEEWDATEQPTSVGGGQQRCGLALPFDQMKLLPLDDGKARGSCDSEVADALKMNARIVVDLLSSDDEDGLGDDHTSSTEEVEWIDEAGLGDDHTSRTEEVEWIDPLLDMDRDEDCIKTSVNCTNESSQVPSQFQDKTDLEQLPGLESKASFCKRRQELSQKLLKIFDKTAFDSLLLRTPFAREEGPLVILRWSNKLRTTAGLTRLNRISQVHHSKQQPSFCGTAVIELSTKVIDDENRLRSTLLHELCHAAAWVVDGTMKPAHGSCFKKWATKAMQAVSDVTVTTTHDYEIDYKYAWSCTNPSCMVVVKRHSRSVDVEKQVCGRCRGHLQEIQVPGKGSMGDYTPRKKAPPSAYNLFVKEQSQQVRQRLQAISNANVTQTEVMKECALLWNSQKDKNM